MRWQGRRGSNNVEDRRGSGGMGGKTLVGGGIGGIIVVIIVILLGGNPSSLLGDIGSGTTTQTAGNYQGTAQEQELADFVSVVLADTEEVWGDVFRQQGLTYTNPTLVLYSGSVKSACGMASSAVGPFYCPGDEKLYIDLSFYDELKQQFQAPGDFAMAYVVAHEVGHHVQNLLGTMDKLEPYRQQLSEQQFNTKYQVRLELQADYYAGVWAHYEQGKNLLEQGDLEEALTAASAVGDDTIQQRTRGYVVPDSFTHGTSEQRKRWFYKGFESGSLTGGDTFSVSNGQL